MVDIAMELVETEGMGGDASVRAVLYDADGSDREVEVTRSIFEELREQQLLWVDIAVAEGGSAEGPWEALGVKRIERALESTNRPHIEAFDRFFHVTVIVVEEGENSYHPVRLHAYVGENWILTAHRPTFDLVGTFNAPLRGETGLGALDGAVFLGTLLNRLLNAYFHVVEDLEGQVDRLDERLLTKDKEVDEEALLRELMANRRRITGLRRLLAPHRDVFTLLAQPDSHALTDSESSKTYQGLNMRLETAIDSIDQIREMLLGSLNVFMTQTAQRTNEVMKVLTVVSVLLLPAIVVAGIMGMNFRVGLFDVAAMFWVTLGVMVALALITIVIARWRKWI